MTTPAELADTLDRLADAVWPYPDDNGVRMVQMYDVRRATTAMRDAASELRRLKGDTMGETDRVDYGAPWWGKPWWVYIVYIFMAIGGLVVAWTVLGVIVLIVWLGVHMYAVLP